MRILLVVLAVCMAGCTRVVNKPQQDAPAPVVVQPVVQPVYRPWWCPYPEPVIVVHPHREEHPCPQPHKR